LFKEKIRRRKMDILKIFWKDFCCALEKFFRPRRKHGVISHFLDEEERKIYENNLKKRELKEKK
jgi:hypothetical protein